MKFLIYTFSGTGNTFLTADFIAKSLIKCDAVVEQFKIEEIMRSNELPDVTDAQYILIGYPIYAFNAPQIVVDFTKILPLSSGQKISIFKTSGEPFFFNNSSSHLMIKNLTAKGYDLISEEHFLMPYNIMFRYPDALVKQMYFFMQEMTDKFTHDLIKNEGQMISYTLLNRMISFLFRIQWSGARLNGRIYTCKHKKCTMCLICVRNCPAKNISVQNGKIRFDGKCMMCMRCVQNCNFNAINIGILRFWAVRGIYDFNRLSSDNSVSAEYINKDTRGYFKLFRPFFKK